MGEKRRGRPSTSTIVACIALFVALGGGAYAAGLAKNSVTSKQIKNNSVKGKDLKADTVGGKQVNESKLGQVPSALNATNATNANNADTLDNLNSGQFLRKDICDDGAVLGSAKFDPALMTAAPSTAGVLTPRNCSGGTVEASRISAGQYRIRFNGIDSTVMVCNTNDITGDAAMNLNVMALNTIAAGHWRVHSYNIPTAGFNDEPFGCVVG